MKTFISFLFVTFLFIGCSSKSSKDYMLLADKNISANKYKIAVNNLEKVVKDYPDSKDAPKALMNLAVIYQNKKIETIDAKASTEKCADYFKQVFDYYPKSKEAPRALFMSGFIYANELHNYEKAKKIYQLFISEYPKDELVESAKVEIKNLGVSADKIIEKNIKKKI